MESMDTSLLFKQPLHLECSESKDFITIVEIHRCSQEPTCWGLWRAFTGHRLADRLGTERRGVHI
jgi:hypothetical protein